MERLEAKQLKGHTYYYYSRWEWVDHRCRRVWQKYLGRADDIIAALVPARALDTPTPDRPREVGEVSG